MKDKIFIDSNIWLYSFIQSDLNKHQISNQIVKKNNISISVQVINEVCFNLKRKASFDESKIEELINSFYNRYCIVDLTQEILIAGTRLRKSYSFSYWDSMIVAAALYNNCNILFTEDMQHEMLVEKSLRIINPFTQIR